MGVSILSHGVGWHPWVSGNWTWQWKVPHLGRFMDMLDGTRCSWILCGNNSWQFHRIRYKSHCGIWRCHKTWAMPICLKYPLVPSKHRAKLGRIRCAVPWPRHWPFLARLGIPCCQAWQRDGMGISMDNAGMGIAYSTGCIFEAQELGSDMFWWKHGTFGCCVVTLAEHLFTSALYPFDGVNHGKPIRNHTQSMGSTLPIWPYWSVMFWRWQRELRDHNLVGMSACGV